MRTKTSEGIHAQHSDGWIINSSKQVFSHTRLLIKNVAPAKSIIFKVK